MYVSLFNPIWNSSQHKVIFKVKIMSLLAITCRGMCVCYGGMGKFVSMGTSVCQKLTSRCLS